MKFFAKEEKGITIIALLITIVIMLILATITVRLSFTSINSASDGVIKSGLEIVQHGLIQEYTKTNTINSSHKAIGNYEVNSDEYKKNKKYPGTPMSASELGAMLTSFSNGNKLDLLNFDNQNNTYKETATYDNVYYKLDSNDLKELGINDANGKEYLINYSTGEVWDIANKTYEKNGQYAYINGAGSKLEVAKEDFSDSNILIKLKEEANFSSDNKYIELSLQAIDDIAKITDEFDTADLTNNVEIKVNDNIIASSKITITSTHTSGNSNVTGDDVEYKLKIDITGISSNDYKVTINIKEGTIIDSEGVKNIPTEIITSVKRPESSTETLTLNIGEPVYTTDNPDPDCQNGFNDGTKTWGKTASFKITLSSTTGLKQEEYLFDYEFSFIDTFVPNLFANRITLRPNAGDKSVSSSIYLDTESGAGYLVVKSADGAGLRASKPVNLDNEPVRADVYVENNSGGKSNIDNVTKDTYFRIEDSLRTGFPIDENDSARYVSKGYSIKPKISVKLSDRSGILTKYVSQTDGRTHYSINFFATISKNKNYNPIQGKDISHYIVSKTVEEAKKGFLSEYTIDELKFDTTNAYSHEFSLWEEEMRKLQSGEFYINLGINEQNANDVFMRDCVGNTQSTANAVGPIKFDFFAPTIENISVDSENGNVQVVVADDYSGFKKSNDSAYKNQIQYAWLDSNAEGTINWKNITDKTISYMLENENGNSLKMMFNINLDENVNNGYLAVRLNNLKDVAGNIGTDIKYADNLEDYFADELEIFVNETGFDDNLNPKTDGNDLKDKTTIWVGIKSKNGKKFAIKEIKYEYDGINIVNEIGVDSNYYTKYVKSFSSVVNGPIIIHIKDYLGKTYDVNYEIKRVQETILKYNISNDEKELVLPIQWSDDIFLHVDWGDNTSSYVNKYAYEFDYIFNNDILNNENSPYHVYGEKKEYEVKISGELIDYQFGHADCNYNTSNRNKSPRMPKTAEEKTSNEEKLKKYLEKEKEQLIGIVQFGIHYPVTGNNETWNMPGWYQGYKNLTKLPNDRAVSANAFSKVKSLGGCFKDSGIESFNYSLGAELTDVQETFYGCENLKSVSKNIFKKCVKIADFKSTFAYSGLDQIESELFYYNNAVTDFSSTFLGCSNLKVIPDRLFWNNDKVTNFSSTFSGCSSIQSIPNVLFIRNEKVTNFSFTFMNCSSIEYIPDGLFAQNTKVNSISIEDKFGKFWGTFAGCESLKSIPTELFAQNTMVKKFVSTFSRCSSLQFIPNGLFDNNKEVTNFSGTFSYCGNITSIPDNLFVENTKTQNFSQIFAYTGITSVSSKIWGNKGTGSEVTTIEEIFGYCVKLTNLEDKIFKNFSKLTNAESVFLACEKLENVDKLIFDNCKNISNIGGMFMNCINLKTVRTDLFDSSKGSISCISSKVEVVRGDERWYIFNGVFENCSSLTSCPDLWNNSKFNKINGSITNNENVYDAFYGVTNNIIKTNIKNNVQNSKSNLWLEEHEYKK